jgi:hypothetical protein
MRKVYALGACLVGIASVVLSAQTASPAVTREAASLDLLLQEVRGLRADLARAGAASIRAQTLVGRIQLQEQRIHSINAQLSDVRHRLSTGEAGLAAPAAALAQLEAAAGTRTFPTERPEFDPLGVLRSQLQLGQKQVQELRQLEADLAQQLLVEQARWTEFNNQLDALERSFAGAR